MKPWAPLSVLLSSFCLAIFWLCSTGALWRSGNQEWRKLIMVQHWPITVCKEVGNNCTSPPDYWTIHGLWPDRAEECNRSWHFDLEEIKDLLPDMKMYWPDVIHPLSLSHFWKHEWEKHGTCAAQLNALNSQKRYFGASLDLYHGLALNSMLQKLGIKPSTSYYQISNIKDALASVYRVIPKLQCLPPKQGEEVQTLGQIELCFTKDLQLENCSEPEGPTEPRVLVPGGQGALWAQAAAVQGPGLEVCKDGFAFYPPPEETPH
ncbi:ribonuclease T2 [Manis javanica]|uniref:ribonuclease T2 n=1 Tax=Manis javanica TaxID=9974 RepID=UPI00081390A2